MPYKMNWWLRIYIKIWMLFNKKKLQTEWGVDSLKVKGKDKIK